MNEKDILKQISSPAETQQPQPNLNPNAIQALMQANPQTAAPMQNITGNADTVRQTAMRDLTILSNLIRSGAINPVQGQHLISYVLNKAQEVVNNQGAAQIQPNPGGMINGIADFEKENPDFFKLNGRGQVLDYLRNSNTTVDKDEVLQISKLIESLEKSAIDGYLQKQTHEKSLKDENQAAKEKLRANAQNSNAADSTTRVFTREQIGKMSGAEFAKNEKAIMEQLRKGLIR